MPVIPSECARDLRKISPGVYPELAEGVEMTTNPNLASLRQGSGHALRPFDKAQDMLGGSKLRIQASASAGISCSRP